MRNLPCALILFSVLAVVAACSSDEDSNAFDADAQRACTEQRKIFCDKAFLCLNQEEREALGLNYTTSEVCAEEQARIDECGSFTAGRICPSSEFHPEEVDGCLDQLRAQTCEAFRASEVPPTCARICQGTTTLDMTSDSDGQMDIEDVSDTGNDVQSDTVSDMTPDQLDTSDTRDQLDTTDTREDVPEDMPPQGTACQSSSDQMWLANNDIAATSSSCGANCLVEPDVGACATQCIAQNSALSMECSECYSDEVVCTIDNCLTDCLISGSASECQQCRDSAGCTAALDACTGPVP